MLRQKGEGVMTREEVLDEAKRIVNGDRNKDYGEPEDAFDDIASLWSAYLERDLNGKDVAAMMILLKVARVKHGDKDDNWVDIAGYAACGAETAVVAE